MRTPLFILICVCLAGCSTMPVVQVPKQHPRVMVVVVTKDYVPQQCWDAILAQDYDNYSMMVHVLKSKLTNPNPNMQYSMRVAENKEIARTMALASAADDFLFVDSSVIIPPNAVSELVAQITVGRPDPNYEKYVEQTLKTKCVYVPKHAIAGYVPFNDSPLTYIMGRYVANYTGIYLHHITQSLTPIDFASCGCIMIDRVTLAKLVWNAGIDRYWMIEGRMAFFDDSCDLCAQIFDMPDETGKGHIQLYADGSVVCQHLPRANP